MIKKIIKLIKRKKPKVIKRVNGVNFVDAFIDDYGVYHPIKGEEKIKVPSENSEEFKMAVWIKENFGGRIDMVPTIETLKGAKKVSKTQTPDYIWNNEKWDLKGIDGNSKNTIGHIFSKYKEQTDNIILFSRKTKIKEEKLIVFIEMSMERYSKYYDNVYYYNNGTIVYKYK